MATLFFILIAYLIGSLSFAVIVTKAFGLPDPRTTATVAVGERLQPRLERRDVGLLVIGRKAPRIAAEVVDHVVIDVVGACDSVLRVVAGPDATPVTSALVG